MGKPDGWYLMVVNEFEPMDPQEVVYQLVHLTGGNVDRTDAAITSADHGLHKRLAEALDRRTLRLKTTVEEEIDYA